MKSKLVIVIAEGVSNRLLEEWKDKLPFIKNLMAANGGVFHTGFVPYEAPNLLSAFTGKSPGYHGVYSYWNVHSSDYIPKIWDSGEIRTPMLWQMNELSEFSFGLLNLFCTFPPYPINGKMISYLQQPSLRGCYPKEYIKELLRKGFTYTSDVFVGLGYGQDTPVSGKNSSPRDEYYRLFEETEKSRVEVALDMMNECDVVIANFTMIDRLSHFFWHEVEPGSPFAAEDTLLFKAYSFMDNVIGKFVNALPSMSNLLVFSEMGYGPLINFVSLNNYLGKGGFLVRENEQNKWIRSLAFESVQGSHGVNINVRGRYNEGMVDKSDYEKVREDVICYLKTVINPKTYLPMFSLVKRKEDVYEGPLTHEAPDILVEMADKRFVPLGDDYWSSRVHRSNQSGWHRKESFWTGSGPAFKNIQKDISVLDIVPSVFDLLNRKPEQDFQGKSILA